MNIFMPGALKPFYWEELARAKTEFDKKNCLQSWRHLERAHIAGQPCPVEHTAVHWNMLIFDIKLKIPKEVLGQIPGQWLEG